MHTYSHEDIYKVCSIVNIQSFMKYATMNHNIRMMEKY